MFRTCYNDEEADFLLTAAILVLQGSCWSGILLQGQETAGVVQAVTGSGGAPSAFGGYQAFAEGCFRQRESLLVIEGGSVRLEGR